MVLQQEQPGRYLGSEQINKPSLGRRSGPGIRLLANLFLVLSATRAQGTPSAQDLSPRRGRQPPPQASAQAVSGHPEFPAPSAPGERTWYMMEDGGGSMHGCWSGRGSSSSRSTLDRASSRVTWVVMAAVAGFCTKGKGCQGPPRVSQPPPVEAPSKEERGFTCTETISTRSFFTRCPQPVPDIGRSLYSLQSTGVFKHLLSRWSLTTTLCDAHGR